MKGLWIMFFCSLIYFAYGKQESTEFPIERFPFSDIKMTWPEYAWTLCTRITFIGFAWALALLNDSKKKYLIIAAIVMTGWGIDFLLECNQGWGHLFGQVISYEAIIFVTLSITTAIAHFDGRLQ
jgi:hypothetical protein